MFMKKILIVSVIAECRIDKNKRLREISSHFTLLAKFLFYVTAFACIHQSSYVIVIKCINLSLIRWNLNFSDSFLYSLQINPRFGPVSFRMMKWLSKLMCSTGVWQFVSVRINKEEWSRSRLFSYLLYQFCRNQKYIVSQIKHTKNFWCKQ